MLILSSFFKFLFNNLSRILEDGGHMELIRVIFLIAIWIIPIIFMTSIYLKMHKEEQVELREELKRLSVLLCVVFPVIGMLIFSSGFISTMKLFQHIGVIMVFIGWFAISVISWKNRRIGFIKSIGLILLGLIGVVAYSYLL